jgi:ribonuclease VapC
MVVDSSALLAITCGDREARPFSDALLHAADPVLSNLAFVECALALVDRFGPAGTTRLDLAMRELGLRRVAVDDTIADAARRAVGTFAVGATPAQLGAGGWVSCALARTLDRPLLFKGGDFLRTDVEVAC